MRKILIQLDTAQHPSVFDRVVAVDAGAGDILSYGGITVEAVRDLIFGAIFTRAPKELRNTAVFIGGSDIAVGERLLTAAQKAFMGPLRVSVMLDSNGSNTTAVAAAAKLTQSVGDVRGIRAVIVGGAGPVGSRTAGLLAKAGAKVTITSPWPDQTEKAAREIGQRFSADVNVAKLSDSSQAAKVIEGAELLLNASKAGVRMVAKEAWSNRQGLRVAGDLNAVPPLGIEGIEVNDDGAERDGVKVFGALAIGTLKMKIHKACIARLFEQNDLILDAESIAMVARDLATSPT